MTYLTNILFPYREGKSKKSNRDLGEILNSYSSGNPGNYENTNFNYPQKSYYRVIVVLGGGKLHTPARVEAAVNIYNQLSANYLIVTIGEDKEEASIAEEIIKKAGIPQDKYIINTESTDTIDNALITKQIVRYQLHAPKRTEILTVTEDPHLPRALASYRLVFRNDYYIIKGVGIEPIPDSYMWSKEERIRKSVLRFYPTLIKLFTSLENFLTYLPGIDEEKADKIVDELIRLSFYASRSLFNFVNDTIGYINKMKENINTNKAIETYRSYTSNLLGIDKKKLDGIYKNAVNKTKEYTNRIKEYIDEIIKAARSYICTPSSS
jgi:uncharacterized SAM-binding protein YcdF (DUF218 family)